MKDIASSKHEKSQSLSMASSVVADPQWDIVRQLFPSLNLPAKRNKQWDKLIESYNGAAIKVL
jgi:hypothetical protein